jgi:hypothetical protein
MLAKVRRYRPSHAVVVAYLALFVALGGSGYAAVRVNGKNIKNRTIAGKKLRKNTLTGKEIKESRLGKVPATRDADRAAVADTSHTLEGLHASAFLAAGAKAANADKLDGLDSASFFDRCRAGTMRFAGACFETDVRAVTSNLNGAGLTCALEGARLPTFPELTAFATQTGTLLGAASGLNGQWEWTSEVQGTAPAGETVANRPSGSLTYDSFAISTALHFRCVKPLTN